MVFFFYPYRLNYTLSSGIWQSRSRENGNSAKVQQTELHKIHKNFDYL